MEHAAQNVVLVNVNCVQLWVSSHAPADGIYPKSRLSNATAVFPGRWKLWQDGLVIKWLQLGENFASPIIPIKSQSLYKYIHIGTEHKIPPITFGYSHKALVLIVVVMVCLQRNCSCLSSFQAKWGFFMSKSWPIVHVQLVDTVLNSTLPLDSLEVFLSFITIPSGLAAKKLYSQNITKPDENISTVCFWRFICLVYCSFVFSSCDNP